MSRPSAYIMLNLREISVLFNMRVCTCAIFFFLKRTREKSRCLTPIPFSEMLDSYRQYQNFTRYTAPISRAATR